MGKSIDRRNFLKKSALTGAALGVAGPHLFARGLNSPNEKVVVAIMGGRSRARRIAQSCARVDGIEIASVYDVDERPLKATADLLGEIQGKTPQTGTDFRRALEDPAIDGLVIGATDHWHAPAAIMAMKAGKHVYVEKPGSHNPWEAEMIVQAQQRYDKKVQLGNQGRSSPAIMELAREVQGGIIGRPYYAKTYYTNNRESIGHGKIVPVPSWLDYELWQGPAPRTPYRDNIIHYNWHWFWKWGTGEINNNGTHRIEYARWVMGLDGILPIRISSNGGRYHYDDDWEFADTQSVTFDFADGKSITWDCRSRNNFPSFGTRTPNAVIYGTEGTAVVDGLHECTVYNPDREQIRNMVYEPEHNYITTDYHFENWAAAIREDQKLNSPLEVGQKTVLIQHLANISQKLGRSLNINPANGRVIGDSEAMSMWRRSYEPGWEPRI